MKTYLDGILIIVSAKKITYLFSLMVFWLIIMSVPQTCYSENVLDITVNAMFDNSENLTQRRYELAGIFEEVCMLPINKDSTAEEIQQITSLALLNHVLEEASQILNYEAYVLMFGGALMGVAKEPQTKMWAGKALRDSLEATKSKMEVLLNQTQHYFAGIRSHKDTIDHSLNHAKKVMNASIELFDKTDLSIRKLLDEK